LNPGRRAEGGRRLHGPPRSVDEAAPLVSYVTVVRNAAATLPRTLASVRAQRWPAVEHVVVDGVSNDGTLAVIEAHAAQIDHYLSEPDAGLYEALNKAVALARGQLVCVLNADDWLTHDAAQVAARALQAAERDVRQPGARLLLTAAWAHDGPQRRLWLPGALHRGSVLACPDICHNGVYATPAALAAMGPYDTRYRIVADSRWLLAALDAGVALTWVDHPTVHYSMGGVSGDKARHVAECARLVAERHPALTEAELWALVHAFYPHEPHLQDFAERRPAHLGRTLENLVQAHAADTALRAELEAAGWQAQRGHATRVRPPRLHVAAKLRRSALKRWHGWMADRRGNDLS
jgi:hypothetical protein